MIVRPAVRSDAGSIGSLLNASFSPDLRPYLPYAQPGVAKYLESLLSHKTLLPHKVFYVSPGVEGVAAFAEFSVGQDEAFLSYLCVDSSARRRGLALALMQQFREQFGAIPIKLDVFANNGAAISLYTKLGFKPVSEKYWLVRSIPDGAAGDVACENVAAALAGHALYGFCYLDVDAHGRKHQLGLLGDTVLRCGTTLAYKDAGLLSSMKACFPELQKAFMVSDELADDGVSTVLTSVLRMEWSPRFDHL